MKSNLIDLPVDVLRTTERAVLIRDHGTDLMVWLPLASCEVTPSDDGKHHVLTLPEWFAQEKELI